MPIGSKRSSGDEYVFVDGRAMRPGEAVRIEVAADAPGEGGQKADAATGVPIAESGAGGAQGKARGKWSAKRALDELESGDAFELSDEMRANYERAVASLSADRRSFRRTVAAFSIALAALALFSLCISVNDYGVLYSPLAVFQALARRAYLGVGQLLGLPYWSPLAPVQANQDIPGYADICARFDVTFVTLVCGFLLSLSGMMYQNVFRNPIAAPTMLGVSSGVRLGTIALVLTFGADALYMEGLRYVYCYIGGIAILLAIMGFSKLIAGKQRPINVADMLIAGSVFAQVLQTASTFFMTYLMDDADYEVFYELTTGARTEVEWYAFIFLFIVVCVAVLPSVLMRFRMNAVSLDAGEARLLGVNHERLRVVVLVLGTLMILAAQVHVGIISMVSLVVPFLVRFIVGSEFGKQLVGNMLLGPLLLLVCRDITALVPFVGAGLSLEMVVGFVALPVYVWMMALGKRGWE